MSHSKHTDLDETERQLGMLSTTDSSVVMTTRHQEHYKPDQKTSISFIVDDFDARSEDNESRNPEYDKEQCDAKIRQMKVEAEFRKNEFARLLEEHAQVIRLLNEMEKARRRQMEDEQN